MNEYTGPIVTVGMERKVKIMKRIVFRQLKYNCIGLKLARRKDRWDNVKLYELWA